MAGRELTGRSETQPAASRSGVAGRTVARPAPRWRDLAGRTALALLAGLVVAFLGGPLVALLLRVPLDSLWHYLADPLVHEALRLTALSSLTALGVMVLLGTPVAYLLARYRFRGKVLLETLLELPLVLPPAVAGVALLFAFGRRTPLGVLLHALNLDIAFTLAAVVLAQAFVAAPFYIKAARGAFQAVPQELLDAAAVQGAGPFAAFRHVLGPLALPGLAGGAIMGWARAVGEFGATILFAGNFPGRTQTMPLAIYTALESDINAAIILAAILVLTSFTVLLTFKLLTGRSLDVLPE